MNAFTDIHIHAQQLVRVRQRIERIMAHHTGQPLEKLERDMERDFYLDAYEAKAYGLVDDVLSSVAAAPMYQSAKMPAALAIEERGGTDGSSHTAA